MRLLYKIYKGFYLMGTKCVFLKTTKYIQADQCSDMTSCMNRERKHSYVPAVFF